MSKNILIGAHRGASAYAPENTFAAFEKALKLKADFIELDVQVSKDGHCVVIHDNTVDRTTNGKGFVFDKTLKELKSFDAGSWFNKNFKNEQIPTLNEVLKWSKKKKAHLQIEIKQLQPYLNKGRYKNIENKIVKMVRKYGVINIVWITSFDELSLKKVKEIEPKLTTGLLTSSGPFVDPLELIRLINADGLHVWWEGLSNQLVKLLHNKGYYISGWGFDKGADDKSLLQVLKNGVDIIAVNDPVRLQKLVPKTSFM